MAMVGVEDKLQKRFLSSSTVGFDISEEETENRMMTE
jgi:hypothetical protein